MLIRIQGFKTFPMPVRIHGFADPDPGLHFSKKIVFIFVKSKKKTFVSGSKCGSG